MGDLLEKIKEEIKIKKKDIFSLKDNDKKYWIKKARATKSSLFHKICYKLLKIELLTPVEYKSEKEAMNFEVSKLQKFASLGINVPEIIFKEDNFFVLEDTGRTIHAYIREKNISEDELYFFIKKGVETIALIHTKNEYHGGAQARNLTYRNDNIYVIDLEDSFSNEIDLKTLQFRDFLLFLLSLTKIRVNIDLDYEFIIDFYITLSGNRDFKKRLNNLSKKVSFLIFIIKNKYVREILGKDVKGFYKLFFTLENLKTDEK